MCALEEVMTCEISFIPLQAENYGAEVEKVLALIEKSGLEFHVGLMSTTIRGAGKNVWSLIMRIYEEMYPHNRFVLDLKVSNVCGCR